MKLAAVVVWYNPLKVDDCIGKILSYAKYVRVYIVDNSPCDNSSLASQIPDSVYIPNLRNLGIAAAQNTGCKRALEDGYDWVMTMDQDSFFDSGQFEHYLQETEKHLQSSEKDVSFSVAMKYDTDNILPLTLVLKNKLKRILTKYLGFHFPVPTPRGPVDHPDRVFASANIIKLSVWDEIGRFDESLFIDEVDSDYCIRLLLGGYRITRFNTLYLNHKLGNKRFTIFPKVTYHSGKRLFYIFRNKLIENKRYGSLPGSNRDYKREIRQYFRDYCILDFRAPLNWYYFTRAYFAYRVFIKSDPTYHRLKEGGMAI